jgi:hypothetical protein
VALRECPFLWSPLQLPETSSQCNNVAQQERKRHFLICRWHDCPPPTLPFWKAWHKQGLSVFGLQGMANLEHLSIFSFPAGCVIPKELMWAAKKTWQEAWDRRVLTGGWHWWTLQPAHSRCTLFLVQPVTGLERRHRHTPGGGKQIVIRCKAWLDGAWTLQRMLGEPHSDGARVVMHGTLTSGEEKAWQPTRVPSASQDLWLPQWAARWMMTWVF